MNLRPTVAVGDRIVLRRDGGGGDRSRQKSSFERRIDSARIARTVRRGRSRKSPREPHLERILPVIDEALRRANATLSDLGAVAVATQPGLVGSLLVGLTAAKTLALVLDIPLLSINHIEAHIYACRMAAGRDVFPAVGFVVSGGHSNLYDCKSPVEFELLGSTTDDAAGEAFDKVAQILGLDYRPEVRRSK